MVVALPRGPLNSKPSGTPFNFIGDTATLYIRCEPGSGAVGTVESGQAWVVNLANGAVGLRTNAAEDVEFRETTYANVV